MTMDAQLDDALDQRHDDTDAPGGAQAASALRAELREALVRAAAVWRDCGVEPGESVGIALANAAEALVASLGVAQAGGCAVMVDPASPPREIERLRERGRWRFILAESREEQLAATRDFVLTRAEWRRALEAARPAAASPATMAA